MPDSDIAWRNWLLHLLCRMYREWGGDCADLGLPPEAIPKLAVLYAENGAPQFDEDSEIATYLDVLSAVTAHLDLADNNLDDSLDKSLRLTVGALQSDLRASKVFHAEPA